MNDNDKTSLRARTILDVMQHPDPDAREAALAGLLPSDLTEANALALAFGQTLVELDGGDARQYIASGSHTAISAARCALDDEPPGPLLDVPRGQLAATVLASSRLVAHLLTALLPDDAEGRIAWLDATRQATFDAEAGGDR